MHAYHAAHTHLCRIAAFVVCNYSSEVERALFPNVRDFIVSGHRQTCSFSRGPSQHFTWLDSIWRESRRALVTVQRRCKVCMSACTCVPARVMYVECMYTFKNSFCSRGPTFQNKGRPYLNVSLLISWGCGCIAGELEDIVRTLCNLFLPLRTSFLFSLSVRLSVCIQWRYSVLIKQLRCGRLFSEHAVKLLTS